jgi:hypothetical protein
VGDSRATLARIILVILVISSTAGCGGLVGDGDSSEAVSAGGSVESSTEIRTRTPTSTSVVRQQTASTNLTTVVEPDSAGLSNESKAKVRRVVVNFYDDLPENETERRNTSLTAAREICEFDRNVSESADTRELKQAGLESETAVRRLRFAAEIVNEHYTTDVDPRAFSRLEEGVKDTTKYVPLIGSYNRLASSSCAVARNPNPRNFDRFHTAALMFGVDTVLIQVGAFYKPAFAGTRLITNSASTVGLYRLRYLCGNRCFALGMSEVHWALRQNMLVAVRNALQFGLDHGMQFTSGDYHAVAQSQGVSTTNVSSDIGIETVTNCSMTAVDSVSNLAKDVRDRSSSEEEEGILNTNVSVNSVDVEDAENLHEGTTKCTGGE